MWEDFYSWIYAHGGLQYPRLFLFFFATFGGVGGALSGGYFAKKISDAYNSSFGAIEGEITLQDKRIPNEVEIEVYQDNALQTKHLVYGKDFKLKLKKGTYTFRIQSKGFEPKVVHNVAILEGTHRFNEMLNVTPKKILLTIKDRSNNPYKALNFNLKKENLSESKTLLSFDQSGTAETPILEPGVRYNLDLLSSWGTYIPNNLQDSPDFLWRRFNYGDNQNLEIGHFLLPGADDKLVIELPRVIQTNMTIQTSGTVSIQNLKSDLKIAQPLLVNSSIKFCSLAFIVFNFATSRAHTFEVREDLDGKPSPNVLLTSSNIEVGDLASQVQAPITTFCKSPLDQATELKTGRYWIVAKFDVQANNVILTGADNKITQFQALYSADGGSWTALNLPFSEIAYYLIE